MTAHQPGEGFEPRRTRSQESMLRGGMRGIALVTLATAALSVVAALIALAVSWLY